MRHQFFYSNSSTRERTYTVGRSDLDESRTELWEQRNFESDQNFQNTVQFCCCARVDYFAFFSTNLCTIHHTDFNSFTY